MVITLPIGVLKAPPGSPGAVVFDPPLAAKREALGLIGVASVLEGDLGGASTIITTVATMMAIALGVLLGLAMTGSLHGFAKSDFDGSEEFEEPEGSARSPRPSSA